MAKLLPALLHVTKWSLRASLKPRPRDDAGESTRVREDDGRLSETFALDAKCGLVSHYKAGEDFDSILEEAFAARWAKLGTPWTLEREVDLVPVPGSAIIPDFRVAHPDGRSVLVEIVGFWRPEYLRKKFALLRRSGRRDIVLAVSERLNLEAAGVKVDEFSGPARVVQGQAGTQGRAGLRGKRGGRDKLIAMPSNIEIKAHASPIPERKRQLAESLAGTPPSVLHQQAHHVFPRRRTGGSSCGIWPMSACLGSTANSSCINAPRMAERHPETIRLSFSTCALEAPADVAAPCWRAALGTGVPTTTARRDQGTRVPPVSHVGQTRIHLDEVRRPRLLPRRLASGTCSTPTDFYDSDADDVPRHRARDRGPRWKSMVELAGQPQTVRARASGSRAGLRAATDPWAAVTPISGTVARRVFPMPGIRH